jgi:hypothetical protein
MAKIPSRKFSASKKKIPSRKFATSKSKIPSRKFAKGTAKIASRGFAKAPKAAKPKLEAQRLPDRPTDEVGRRDRMTTLTGKVKSLKPASDL